MAERETIRVMLVDDHAVVRSGLGAFLMAYDDFELVGEASGGEEAIRLCGTYQPDVVLMDLVMPGMDGAEATGLIREKFPQTQVIALTSFKEQDLVEGAIKAGALSYLLKDVSAEDLAEAIRGAAAGEGRFYRPGSRAIFNFRLRIGNWKLRIVNSKFKIENCLIFI